MKKDLFYIGRFSVHGYGLMIGIGFILALFLGEYRAKKKGMKEEAIIDLAIIAAVGGFLGAKILYIIVSLKEFLQNPLAVIGSEGFVVWRNYFGCSLLHALLQSEEVKIPGLF